MLVFIYPSTFFILRESKKIAVEGDGNLLHGVFCLVFGEVACPDDDYLPSGGKQQLVVPSVPFAVTVDLRLPEGGVSLGQYELSASLMSVLETAVYKGSRSVSAHHYIRCARHALHVQPVPVSVRPQPFPDRYLRFRRLAADM